MARLIVAGGQGRASVALSLNTSTMYFGFSIGSAIGAGIIAAGDVWMIGAAAAVMELVALALDKIWKRNGI
jgi:MFS transporter, DHA1 family, purine base/nucleoside efflux pump